MPKEDVWIHTTCDVCMGACGILVRRVDGVVREIKGDPDFPNSRGKICARGQAGLMGLYDPSRVKTPLRRTNPEKGMGVDPGWEAISWEEAMNILVERLGKVRKEDPRKLAVSSFDEPTMLSYDLPLWGKAFGTPNARWGAYFCGKYLHSSMYLTNGSFHCDFDADYCNYLMLFGNQAGFGTGLNPNITAQKVALARKRGMRVVVVDPICNNSGSKADEWVPLRPGTDGALVLSLLNVLVNELGIYDREFLKRYTNAPYLVKPDGYYMRRDGKPVVWDAAESKAKPYDALVEDYSLEGHFGVDGVECVPAFQLLKEHVKKYTPEKASEITTVLAATIRRLAREFGEAARIGSTITIDGVVLPFRPVAANIYRGAGAHKHGQAVALALQTLNMVVGAFYVPGGHRGLNLIGPAWSWQPGTFEGLVIPPLALAHGKDYAAEYYRYEVKAPETMELRELFPIATGRAAAFMLTSLDPKKYKLSYEPEVLLVCKRNLFRGGVNHEIVATALKRYKFITQFGTHLDETSEFADLFLPDTIYLERLQVFPQAPWWSLTGMTGYWYYGIRQPVVAPPGEARDWADVILELADRLGFRGELYELFNVDFSLRERYKLDPARKYTREEIGDRRLKSQFGEEKGLEWFKKNGSISFKRKVDELYPLPWLKVRFPLYYENFLDAGKKVGEVTQGLGLKDWDVSDYRPLLDWQPCKAYSEPGDFDLYASNFRVPTHSQSWTVQNPWLCEIAELNPYTQKILINSETARRKGIKDGDRIWVESELGRVSARAKATQCIHPEVVGISSHFGSLVKGMPVAQGKGANFNNLLPLEIDWFTSGVDACVRVKVSKIP